MTFDPLSRDARLNSALITCLNCGKRIKAPKYKFCSRHCADLHHNPLRPKKGTPKACKECGKPFGPERPSPRSHFCSPACRQTVFRRNWRNYQRRLRNSDLPQNGPAISSAERVERSLKATGRNRRKQLVLPFGWKDTGGYAFKRLGKKNGNSGKKDTLND